MINKLDPRQYNPYALNTPSGNLSFEEGVDFFNCHLLENLTGDFNIFGSLRVDNGKVVFSDSSNLIEDNNNSIINSFDSVVSGSNNTLISSSESNLNGNYNVIVGGEQNIISDSDFSAVIFGSSTTNQNTGSVIIADGDVSRAKDSVKDYALTIDFDSGAFILNDIFVEGSIHLSGNTEISNGDLTVKEGNSSIFEGDINVSGTAFNTGSPLQNLQNLTDSSGQLLDYTTGLSGIMTSTFEQTGIRVASDIEASGIGSVTHANSISGVLTEKFDGNLISGNIVTAKSVVIDSGRFIPSNFNSTGISGQLSFDQQYFYVCTGDDGWARILFDTSWGGLS